MKLKEWLKTNKMSGSALARELGVSRISTSLWINDQVKPGKVRLEKIKELTKGSVTETDFETKLCPWCRR